MAEDLMDKVFSFFSKDGLTDEKQNMLKSISKELSQSKYVKFFRMRSEETDPSFMSFLFSIYKTIYPIKMFMKDEVKINKLKTMTVDACIDGNVKEIIKRLDTAALDEKAKSLSGEQLIASIQADVDLLTSRFNTSQIAAVNHRYQMVSVLNQFVLYNFSAFFKKFDPHFVDGSFVIEPKFPAIKTILMVDQIGEFLTVVQSLKAEEDWTSVINLINTCEGLPIVNVEQFNNMIKMLREVHASKILELMIQYTLRNPVWHYKHTVFTETIGEIWLESKRADALNYIARINNAKKNSQISALTKEIFESTDLTRLENYTVQISETYRRKKVEYFLYAEGLNYFKAFLDDYIEKEIKEICDIIIIRGQWTNVSMSREMSEALHRLLELQTPINDLDIVMSEDGNDGSRLRSAMLRVDRDQTQVRYINSIVGSNNQDALEIINKAAQDLIIIGKHLKVLIEDIQKKHPELLINWRELTMFSKEPLSQRMISDYKKINYFIQLMHLCTN
ncbi:MAG: DUF5312 family protein [Treponema sp.]|jgi:hypothetical protein|nr:DUF5312 family protein [Treponema sp.]